ncbi:EamA family transporter [Alloscardovia omnicolens]|uniref:EamA family transporter n=1 Tax=Alloscardovia omnicolens TaxID=419015 RepID=UPI003A604A68
MTSGVLWGTYIVLGRLVAHGSSGLDNLTISLTLGWIIQSCVIGVPAVKAVIHPATYATWAHSDGGWLKLVALMFVITLGASIVSYIFDQVLMRRVSANRFSVMQAVLPAVNLFVSLFFGDRPVIMDFVGVAIIVFAVVISFSSDNDPLPSHDLTSRHHAKIVDDDGNIEPLDVLD